MLKKIVITLLTTLMLNSPVFSETWRDVLPNAKLVGQGEFRWFVFDIYTARLWSTQVPFDVNAPFALALTYHRHITSDEFVKSSMGEIKRIFGSTWSAEKLQKWEKELTHVFPDVHAGDQLTGVYLPERGCIFFDKNRRLAKIDDPQLAQAFFAIWLDKRTRDKSLRANLLGESK